VGMETGSSAARSDLRFQMNDCSAKRHQSVAIRSWSKLIQAARCTVTELHQASLPPCVVVWLLLAGSHDTAQIFLELPVSVGRRALRNSHLENSD